MALAQAQTGRAGAHSTQEERPVKVIAGRDKGKTGRVLSVDPANRQGAGRARHR